MATPNIMLDGDTRGRPPALAALASRSRGHVRDYANSAGEITKFWTVGVASMAALIMLAAGCSSGSNTNTPLNVEKANIVVDALPAIDSAGLYIAQMNGRPKSMAS